MIAKLPLVPFVIINLTHLTAHVCMKVRFKSKVTRGFSLPAASRLVLTASRLKKNLWDHGSLSNDAFKIRNLGSSAPLPPKNLSVSDG